MKKLNRVGEKYTTNQEYIAEIVEYFSSLNVTLKFEDGTTVYNIRYGNLKRGNVAHPFHKSVYNVGYLGIGSFKGSKNGVDTVCYSKWYNMLSRCYSPNRYKDVVVCDEWHNYQNFAKWFEENWRDYMDSSWHLDKDIRIKSNKIYNSESCMIIPKEVNNLFVKTTNKNIASTIDKNDGIFTPYLSKNGITIPLGRFKKYEEAFQAYKTAKEDWIKEFMKPWESIIDDKNFSAIVNYKI